MLVEIAERANGPLFLYLVVLMRCSAGRHAKMPA